MTTLHVDGPTLSTVLERATRMKKSLISKRPLSLRARGVQLLSQREQSVSELRKKLQRHARLLAAFDAADVEGAAHRDSPDRDDQEIFNADDLDSAVDGGAPTGQAERVSSADSASNAVTDVLIWLQEKGYLSDARFTQSRVEVRSARFGNVRIRQELALHDIELNSDAEKLLRNSELERAIAVLQRKFPQATGASEVARQARFLRQRGFSFDVIRQALKVSVDAEVADGET